MTDNQIARITVGLPVEVTKALRMKAIKDEISSAEIVMNALAAAYDDDELLSKPLEEALAHSTEPEQDKEREPFHDAENQNH